MVSATTWSSVRQPQQHAAQQRTAGEIERAAGLFAGQGESRRLARGLRQPRQVDHAAGRRGPAAGSPAPARRLRSGEDRAQRLVAAHDLAEAARQHRGSQRPFDAQRHRHVVERAARLELVDEPEPLLGERQGQGPLPAAPAREAERSAPRRSGAPPRPGRRGPPASGPRRGRAAAARRRRRCAGATSPASPAASGRRGRRSGRPPRPVRGRGARPRCRRGPLRPACAAPA